MDILHVHTKGQKLDILKQLHIEQLQLQSRHSVHTRTLICMCTIIIKQILKSINSLHLSHLWGHLRNRF